MLGQVRGLRYAVVARKAAAQLGRELHLAAEEREARRLRSEVNPSDGAAGQPHVVFLAPRSWAHHVQVEAVLAQALRLRGARVTFLTCGGGREICDRINVTEGPPTPCRTCRGYVEPALGAHGLHHRALGSFGGPAGEPGWPLLDTLSISDLVDVEADGLPLGSLVDLPAAWFLLSSDVAADPLSGQIRRSFLREARVVARQLDGALTQLRPDIVVLLNGTLFFEAIALYLALERGIDVVSYEIGHRAGSLFFRRGPVPACRYDIGELWDRVRNRPLTTAQEGELDRYLEERRTGRSADTPWGFRAAPVTDDGGGRSVVLFTNVTWDTAAIGQDVAFGDIRVWMDATIGLMAEHPSDRLTVRIHPAEVSHSGHRTREPFGRYLDRRYPTLPDNVTVIDADDPASSYDLMRSADVGLVYTSTSGLELALMGVPVIVPAAPHYRGKGFTVDVSTASEYRAALERALEDPGTLRPDVELARRYAHAFFFSAPIPFPQVTEPLPGLARLAVRHADELRPGASASLDRICDSLLAGTDFFEQ